MYVAANFLPTKFYKSTLFQSNLVIHVNVDSWFGIIVRSLDSIFNLRIITCICNVLLIQGSKMGKCKPRNIYMHAVFRNTSKSWSAHIEGSIPKSLFFFFLQQVHSINKFPSCIRTLKAVLFSFMVFFTIII